VLGTSHGSRPLDSDPMLLFAHMLAHSAVIRLGHAAQRSPSLAGWRSVDKQGTIASYRNRGLNAAAEMAHLARQIPSFSAVRAHPFLPDPVGCAVEYLTNPTSTTAAAKEGEMAVTATKGGKTFLHANYRVSNLPANIWFSVCLFTFCSGPDTVLPAKLYPPTMGYDLPVPCIPTPLIPPTPGI